jgi:choline dehydrogenase-like flavoprotein
MFIDLRSYPLADSVEYDIAIVGAGPAGIALAQTFLGTPTRLCLIESGDTTHSSAAQELAVGENAGQSYFTLDTCRFRRFGGSLNGWPPILRHAGTVIAPMTEIDFVRRPWVPDSGWPINLQTLEPYYAHAQSMFATGPWNYAPAAYEGDRRFLHYDPDLLVTTIWQSISGFNWGDYWGKSFQCAPNITVLTNATATEILTDDTGQVARGLRVCALTGNAEDVRARVIVLAAGGIENARLLLLSHHHTEAGLGNRYGVVGRYFMEHPHTFSASVTFRGERTWLNAYKDFQVNGHGLRAGIATSAKAQRNFKLLNHSAILVDRFLAVGDQESAGYMAAKELIMQLVARRLDKSSMKRVATIARHLPTIIRGINERRAGRTGALYTRSEQSPNRDSRVTLSDRRDGFGLRRAKLIWRLNSLDKWTIKKSVELIAHEFERLGIGQVTPDHWLVSDDNSWPDFVRGGYHHLGTTRMGSNPRSSVVDPNCQVHGIANLYVAGSSVFPTGSHVNPTLTITALALRLAQHLKSELNRHAAITTFDTTRSDEIIQHSSSSPAAIHQAIPSDVERA